MSCILLVRLWSNRAVTVSKVSGNIDLTAVSLWVFRPSPTPSFPRGHRGCTSPAPSD